MITRKQWVSCGLFSPYFDQEWDPTRCAPEAWASASSYIDNVSDHREKGRGLLICGFPGTGKTHLAHEVAKSILGDNTPIPREVVAAMTVNGWVDLFRRRMDLIAIVQKTGNQDAADQYLVLEQRIRHLMFKQPWVILDDLGKEYSTDTGFGEFQLDRLLRTRGNRGLPTIITTNYSIPMIAERLSQSLASYIFQICDIVLLTGVDERRRP